MIKINSNTKDILIKDFMSILFKIITIKDNKHYRFLCIQIIKEKLKNP